MRLAGGRACTDVVKSTNCVGLTDGIDYSRKLNISIQNTHRARQGRWCVEDENRLQKFALLLHFDKSSKIEWQFNPPL